MTSRCDLGSNPIAKAMSADFASMGKRGRACVAALLQAGKWLTQQGRGVLTRGVSRRLAVAETLSLGEKRFVSILTVDGEQFLVAGSPSNIVLLAKLEANSEAVGAGSFESVLSHAGADVKGSEINKNPARVIR